MPSFQNSAVLLPSQIEQRLPSVGDKHAVEFGMGLQEVFHDLIGGRRWKLLVCEARGAAPAASGEPAAAPTRGLFRRSWSSQTRFRITVLIDCEPERPGLFPSQLADKLDISRPVVTNTMRAMEAAGLLVSTDVAEDGCAKLVSLTSAGRAKLDHLLPGYYAVIGALMNRENGNAA